MIALLALVFTLPALAQEKFYTIEIGNRSAFLKDNKLDTADIPTSIELYVLDSTAFDANPRLAEYMDAYFEATKYKAKKGKLVLEGVGWNNTLLEYTLLLEEQAGVLKIDGYGSIPFEAIALWKCTNHNGEHSCGVGDRECLQSNSKDNGCVF